MSTLITSPQTYTTSYTPAPSTKLAAYVDRKARQWSRFALRAAVAWQKYDNAVDLRKPLAEVMALGEKADCFEECQLDAHRKWDAANGMLVQTAN